MKRLFLLLYFLPLYVAAAPAERLLDVSEQIKQRIEQDHFQSIERLIQATILVECGGNYLAVGRDNDLGPLQITPVRLRDYNRRTGKGYTHQDCFRIEVSREIFIFYAQRIGTDKSNWQQIARRWNGGPAGHKIASTKQYWNKIQKQLNQIV